MEGTIGKDGIYHSVHSLIFVCDTYSFFFYKLKKTEGWLFLVFTLRPQLWVDIVKKMGEYFYTWKLDQLACLPYRIQVKIVLYEKDKKSHSQVLCLCIWKLTSMKNYVMGTCTKSALFTRKKKRRHYAFMKNIKLTSLWTASVVLRKSVAMVSYCI